MEKITTIFVSAKCSDLCFVDYFNKAGENVGERDDYVPKFMPERGGDYVSLEIEIATGKILNWKVPTQKELKDSMD